MNHCPNMNAPAIKSGKVSADELDARIADWQQHYAACTANACQSGRMPCPCPDACRLPSDGSQLGFGLAICAVSAVAVCALLVMVFA